MVLADTSVWVEFMRRGAQGRAAALRQLLDSGEVVVCGPVAAELLAGTSGEVFERMWDTLASLSWVNLDRGGWRDLGALAARLRSDGRRLPLTDLQIAAAAVRGKHSLWSFDSDFERIAEVFPDLALYVPE